MQIDSGGPLGFHLKMPLETKKQRGLSAKDRRSRIPHNQPLDRALVVDDDSAIREIISSALTRVGYDVVTAASAGAMTDIRVGLVWLKGAGEATGLDVKQLGVRGPWYDRLDATEAVRALARAGAREALVIAEASPLLLPDATCLDVWYDGTPADVPPQVIAVEAVHRAGQTLITWNGIEDPLGKSEVKSGESSRKNSGR